MRGSFAAEVVRPAYFRVFPQRSQNAMFTVLQTAIRLIFKRVSPGAVTVRELRKQVRAWDERLGTRNADDVVTPVICNDVAAEWLDVPGSRPERVILYFHGGAFILRFPIVQRAMVSRWCRALRARALMPGYRLAPEHPYPAGPDDCLSTYRWLLSQGYDPKNIIIAGESAGGNLSLVTLLRARDEGLPMPGCSVIISPPVDFSMSGRSAVVNEVVDPMFTLELMRWFGELYLSDIDRYLDPTVSPLVGDFTGLPPILFQVGGAEMLLDDSTRAASKANAAGVTVQLDIFEGMPHVFQAIPTLVESLEADKSIVEFIGRHVGWKKARALKKKAPGGAVSASLPKLLRKVTIAAMRSPAPGKGKAVEGRASRKVVA